MAFNWTFGRIASASSTAARCNYDLAAVTPTAKTVATPAPATKAFGMALNAADLSMLSMSNVNAARFLRADHDVFVRA